MMGYGLGSHCVVIFLGTIIHTSHDHLFFYALWAIVGGLSTLRMVSIILSRTHGQTQRMIVCGAVAALNLLFLLYLHFAYHQIVEDLSEVFHQNPVMMEKPVIIPTKGVNPPTVAANRKGKLNHPLGLGGVYINKEMTHQAKKVIEPMTDTVVKAVNKTVTAAVKQLANQKGPLLNALKDGVKLANAKPA
ncbi:protein YIPF3-like [Ruditapes philippinarum]|uniref:protein YIPF3-like n=1 Tax=Ruditapes philippinarum TaxID=129788 RepID=UPI00295A71E7|nr:protein YIPF3-like [Ruditapes philippinarum]